ncbi:PREDICTED: uncharacterized protein LOC109178657 [Ipomoea nil]|uniref:uncharacterized protein LOC109178657 n=1 Tax=Ipomoea nil TaxID=35883 RepID=UPI000900FDA8|nr:PREDICTED: uncharacterized protein LOC109178657 [Ipomoea nil]
MERDHANRSRPLAFNLFKFDDWKVRMQAHLSAIHDEMWEVIEEGPIVVMMVNAQAAAQGADPEKCKTAKEIWDTLMSLGEGDEQEKDNKLTVAMKKFEEFKMLPNETIADMEFRFTKLMGEILDLGKEATEKEKNLKIL